MKAYFISNFVLFFSSFTVQQCRFFFAHLQQQKKPTSDPDANDKSALTQLFVWCWFCAMGSSTVSKLTKAIDARKKKLKKMKEIFEHSFF